MSTPITMAPFALGLEPGPAAAEAAPDSAPDAVKVGVWRQSPLDLFSGLAHAGTQAIGDIWQVTGVKPTQLAITVAPEVFEELAVMERTPVIAATFEPDRITILVRVEDGSHVDHPPIPLVFVCGGVGARRRKYRVGMSRRIDELLLAGKRPKEIIAELEVGGELVSRRRKALSLPPFRGGRPRHVTIAAPAPSTPDIPETP